MNLLCVVCLCAISAGLLVDLRRDAALNAETTSRNLVDLLARDIARSVELYDLSLREVVENLKEPDVLAASPHLKHVILFDPVVYAEGFGQIVVADETGKVTMSSDKTIPAISIGQHEFFRYFATHADNSIHISEPLVSRLSGKRIMILSRRLEKDGAFAGVVAGAILIDYFHDLFIAVGTKQLGVVTLYGPGGKLVMREPYDQQLIGTSVADAPSYQEMTKSHSGSFSGPAIRAEGERRFVFKQVGTFPLVLAVAVIPAEIFASWEWKALSLGAIVLALCATTMILTWLFRREIRGHQGAAQALEKLATTDALTGLHNRRRFDEVLSRECRRALRTQSPLSLLLFDADCFKGFNDHYGHQCGDEALKLIARSIDGVTDRASDVACRIGGEEFAVILADTDIAGAAMIAQRIVDVVATCEVPHDANPHGVVTISGGVAALFMATATDKDELVAAADRALYAAKTAGRNRIEAVGPQVPFVYLAAGQ
ncbi:diguanylate cyclase [Beijerinckia sp. L45]|uniref:sensor domain-containing diguanylate cyclase n=1 Tax=Beijerinckia sp. L45 TaxID=1641855 RepID=UPI00131B6028|nr:diguanylate cyclase [Beijerinckia sp. L45]